MNEKEEYQRAKEALKENSPLDLIPVFFPEPHLAHSYNTTITHSLLSPGIENSPLGDSVTQYSQRLPLGQWFVL